MSNVITIVERGEDLTAIKLNGVEIHEGSGEHTREAMRELAGSFATFLGYDLDYEEEGGNGDWSC